MGLPFLTRLIHIYSQNCTRFPKMPLVLTSLILIPVLQVIEFIFLLFRVFFSFLDFPYCCKQVWQAVCIPLPRIRFPVYIQSSEQDSKICSFSHNTSISFYSEIICQFMASNYVNLIIFKLWD